MTVAHVSTAYHSNQSGTTVSVDLSAIGLEPGDSVVLTMQESVFGSAPATAPSGWDVLTASGANNSFFPANGPIFVSTYHKCMVDEADTLLTADFIFSVARSRDIWYSIYRDPGYYLVLGNSRASGQNGESTSTVAANSYTILNPGNSAIIGQGITYESVAGRHFTDTSGTTNLPSGTMVAKLSQGNARLMQFYVNSTSPTPASTGTAPFPYPLDGSFPKVARVAMCFELYRGDPVPIPPLDECQLEHPWSGGPFTDASLQAELVATYFNTTTGTSITLPAISNIQRDDFLMIVVSNRVTGSTIPANPTISPSGSMGTLRVSRQITGIDPNGSGTSYSMRMVIYNLSVFDPITNTRTFTFALSGALTVMVAHWRHTDGAIDVASLSATDKATGMTMAPSALAQTNRAGFAASISALASNFSTTRPDLWNKSLEVDHPSGNGTTALWAYPILTTPNGAGNTIPSSVTTTDASDLMMQHGYFMLDYFKYGGWGPDWDNQTYTSDMENVVATGGIGQYQGAVGDAHDGFTIGRYIKRKPSQDYRVSVDIMWDTITAGDYAGYFLLVRWNLTNENSSYIIYVTPTGPSGGYAQQLVIFRGSFLTQIAAVAIPMPTAGTWYTLHAQPVGMSPTALDAWFTLTDGTILAHASGSDNTAGWQIANGDVGVGADFQGSYNFVTAKFDNLRFCGPVLVNPAQLITLY